MIQKECYLNASWSLHEVLSYALSHDHDIKLLLSKLNIVNNLTCEKILMSFVRTHTHGQDLDTSVSCRRQNLSYLHCIVLILE